MKYRVEPRHDLHDFMVTAGQKMQDEYERIQKRSNDDPGTAGDQGEKNWRELIDKWVPPYYQVVNKGRILNERGEASPQVDVLVLHPAYPKELKDVKLYLAAGVVAAFECKVTLKASHISRAIECGKKIRQLLPKRRGTPYRELNSPLLFGLLAHSHSWKNPSSDPRGKISKVLFDQDTAIVEHPVEMLDFLCVADLGTWAAQKDAYRGPMVAKSQADTEAVAVWNQNARLFGDGCAVSGYVRQWERDLNYGIDYTPIGSFLTSLFHKLAWEDSPLRPLAKYFEGSRMGAGGGESIVRSWPLDIYSKEVRDQLSYWRPPALDWDEWASFHM